MQTIIRCAIICSASSPLQWVTATLARQKEEARELSLGVFVGNDIPLRLPSRRQREQPHHQLRLGWHRTISSHIVSLHNRSCTLYIIQHSLWPVGTPHESTDLVGCMNYCNHHPSSRQCSPSSSIVPRLVGYSEYFRMSTEDLYHLHNCSYTEHPRIRRCMHHTPIYIRHHEHIKFLRFRTDDPHQTSTLGRTPSPSSHHYSYHRQIFLHILGRSEHLQHYRNTSRRLNNSLNKCFPSIRLRMQSKTKDPALLVAIITFSCTIIV